MKTRISIFVFVFMFGILSLSACTPKGEEMPTALLPAGIQGYSPLRRLNVVSWIDASTARLLKSASEVLEAQQAGEVTIEQPGVVVNMPFVVWDGGKR